VSDSKKTPSVKQERRPPSVSEMKTVNKSVPKVDGLSLTTGWAKFVDDMAFDGMLHGKVLWSPHAHARIKAIDTRAARAIDGVVAVLTHEDVPRIPHTTAGQGYPEPSPYDTFVLDNKVRFVGDRVAVVAAETRLAAERAVKAIRVEYEMLEPVFDLEKAFQDGVPVIHDEEDALRIPDAEHNIAATVGFKIGEDFFASSDVTAEGTFRTQYAQHCPIEPHIVIGWLDEHGRITLRSSTQVPFHARRIVAQSLGIPVKKVRVMKPRIGGGFGTKQEIVIEDLVAALVMKTKRPVKMEYTRAEEFFAARTRHPMTVYLKIGAKKDGSVTDADLKVISNTGAYGSHALTVICCTGGKVLPLYHFDKMDFHAKAVYTNLPVAGAYRGYGATQAAFAMECLIDEITEKLGVDPIEFRKKNHIKEGETSPVFKLLGEGREGVPQTMTSVGLTKAMELGAAEIGWKEKRRKPGNGPIKRGVGMCALMQGSAIPGVDMASAHIKLNEDGSFSLLIGAADLGTGADTVIAQIAAEELTIKQSDIIVYAGDTDVVPFDVGAYASSTTYLSGMAARKAAYNAKQQILQVAAQMLEEPIDDLHVEGGRVHAPSGRSVSFSEVSLHSLYMVDQFQIQGSASHVSDTSPPPFSAHFAEVTVDTETGLVKVIKYVAAIDCGTAINPKLAEGQTEGAVMNGISYALTEEMIFDEKGTCLNPSFHTYKIYNSRDYPELKTILVPTYEPSGPYGAKSVSEIGINGPIPSIANAIYDACGVRMKRAPFTPERVLAAIREKEKKR
jgi:putative selenate reductase molybdopterin-binding subunit